MKCIQACIERSRSGPLRHASSCMHNVHAFARQSHVPLGGQSWECLTLQHAVLLSGVVRLARGGRMRVLLGPHVKLAHE